MTFQKIVLPAPTLPQLDVPDHLPELIDCSDLDDDDDASCTEELDDEADQQDDIYTAEEIVKQRLRNGQLEYLIKWLGFPASHNTWEPAENILDKHLITLFHKKHLRAKRLTTDPDYVPFAVCTRVSASNKNNQGRVVRRKVPPVLPQWPPSPQATNDTFPAEMSH